MPSLLLYSLTGLIAGIIVNYLSDTLPYKRKIAKPFCTSCGKQQQYGNYFIWPRHCPNCGQRRGIRNWLVEIVGAALFPWYFVSVENAYFLPTSLAVLVLIYFGVVIVIDIEHRLILHPVSLAGALLGLILGIYLHGLLNTLMGGAIGFLAMLFLYWLGTIFTRATQKMQGSEEEIALGFGDVNLAGVLGLMLGFPNIILGLILSIFIGGVISLGIVGFTLLIKKYKAFRAIPYAPILIAGAVLMLFFPAEAQVFLSVVGPLFWLSP